MKNYLFLFVMLSLIISCKNSNYHYSESESKAFLDEITKNAKASITDITEIKKLPTDLFGIITRYPLSKKNLDEYNKNKGTIVNKDDDISDFVTYTFKSYELISEKNVKLQFVDTGRAIYLQEHGLWDYDRVLCQNLGLELRVNDRFTKLKGYIDVEFEMPDGEKKEVKIPVDISVQDQISE
jgi:hypothetical protein